MMLVLKIKRFIRGGACTLALVAMKIKGFNPPNRTFSSQIPLYLKLKAVFEVKNESRIGEPGLTGLIVRSKQKDMAAEPTGKHDL